MTALIKRHESIVLENSENTKEKQQLKKKLRKMTARLQKKEEECEHLQNELVRTKDLYDHKITKLIRAREERTEFTEQGDQKGGRDKLHKRNKSREVQC